MKRLMIILLIAFALSISPALAQEEAKTISFGDGEAKEGGTPAASPETPAAAGAPSTQEAVPAEYQRYYIYTGSGTQMAASPNNEGAFTAKPPEGWDKDDISLVGSFQVHKSSIGDVQSYMAEHKKMPTRAYDGIAVFENSETGTKTIFDNGRSYDFKNDQYILGRVESLDYGRVTLTMNDEGKPVYLTGDGKTITREELMKGGGNIDQMDTLENKLSPEERERIKNLQKKDRTKGNQQWNDYVMYYRAYRGLAGFSSLIFDEEFLKDWKDTVNEIMCDKLKIGGKDCWLSHICGKYADIVPSRAGVLYTSNVGGAPPAVAHIEGRRSLPIARPNETFWGYTVTYSLNNPEEDDTMSYNVQFKGPQRVANWWSSNQALGPGATARGIGSEALYKVSNSNYNEVCLTFSPEIKSFGGKRINSICNDITQYAGGASAPYSEEEASAEEGTEGSAPAPSTPQTPGGSV